MISLHALETYEQTLSKLKGFSVLLSASEVRDALPQDTATGLEYILLEIVEEFERVKIALAGKQ